MKSHCEGIRVVMEPPIKNLVLDMGNVLLGWAPEAFALRAAGDPADADILNRALFASPDWPLHDAGKISEEELLGRASERVPARLKGKLSELVESWPAWMPPVPGAFELVHKAKEASLNIYLLSNAGVRFPEALKEHSFYPYFDGMMVSYHEQLAKPDVRIFTRLCDRFSLNPKECLFVDDIAANVRGALAAGLQALEFTGDWQPVKDKLGI